MWVKSGQEDPVFFALVWKEAIRRTFVITAIPLLFYLIIGTFLVNRGFNKILLLNTALAITACGLLTAFYISSFTRPLGLRKFLRVITIIEKGYIDENKLNCIGVFPGGYWSSREVVRNIIVDYLLAEQEKISSLNCDRRSAFREMKQLLNDMHSFGHLLNEHFTLKRCRQLKRERYAYTEKRMLAA